MRMSAQHRGEQSLIQGPLGSGILMFSIPLILSNLLQVLFNMADIAVVGRFAGSIALGAVGSTTTLIELFTGFLIGMAGGVNALTARYFGAGDEKNLSDTVHTAVLICVSMGIVLTVLGMGFARPILALLRTKPELIDGAVLYLRIYFLGMPALGIYNFGSAVFSAVGQPRRPLWYLFAAGVVNIVLNLFFVIVCRLNVAGVAIASVISQYISAVLVTVALLRTEGSYGLRRAKVRLKREKSLALLNIGIPGGLQFAIFGIANLYTQVGVNSFSAAMVAGNSAAANADVLVHNVMGGFYTACSSFIGQNYGAGQRERVRKSYCVCMGYSFCAGMALGLLLLIAGPQFLSVFTDDPAVVEMGLKRLHIMSVSYGACAFMDCTIAASRGLGKSVVPMILVILGSCVFRIVWIYTIFAYFHTIASLYLLYIFSWTITAAAEILYFVHIYRRLLREHQPARTAASA